MPRQMVGPHGGPYGLLGRLVFAFGLLLEEHGQLGEGLQWHSTFLFGLRELGWGRRRLVLLERTLGTAATGSAAGARRVGLFGRRGGLRARLAFRRGGRRDALRRRSLLGSLASRQVLRRAPSAVVAAARATAAGAPGFVVGPLTALRLGPLAARRDHRQRYPAALLLDLLHPHPHHVADRDHVVRVFDVPVRHLADVDQPGVLEADIHERTEIDDVQHA